jgi:hypothetical protein
MRIIELRAERWRSILDFYHALLTALEAPDWHGVGCDAAIDSIVWGGINGVVPPYTIRVVGAAALPQEIRDEIELLGRLIAEHREDHRRWRKKDVEVALELVPNIS